MTVTTLVGSNSFLIEQIVNERIQKFVVKNGNMGIESINGLETQYIDIVPRITSVSLFSSNKLVILKDISHNNELVEHLDELLTAGDSTELIIVDPTIDGRSKLYKKLKLLTNFRAINELPRPSLVDWMIEYVNSKQATISRVSADYLLDRVGLNQLVCYQELNKLMLYDKKIDRTSIDLLVESNPQSRIFDLVNNAFKHNHRLVIQIYQELRSIGEDTSKIIGLLAWQLHLIAVVKSAVNKTNMEIANDLGGKPMTINETKKIANSIRLEDLKQIIDRLLKIDDKSKQQTINIDDALLYFLLSF